MPHSTTLIRLPTIAKHLKGEFVTCESPMAYRRAIELMATYFQREGGWDAAPFDAKEFSYHYKAYPFYRNDYFPRRDGYANEIFGAACFRYHYFRGQKEKNYWTLQWAWLHPYFRRHGYLTKAWPKFVQEFGPSFIPETPYSKGMKDFMFKNATAEQKQILLGGGYKEPRWMPQDNSQ